MGFEVIFYGRIDIHEELERLDRKEMQFLWDTHCGKEILVEALINVYNNPPGFNSDFKYKDDA